MNRAIMIDNETLAFGPNAFLTQVGLCVADLDTHVYEVGPQSFWMTTEGQEGRRVDLDTLAWWAQQNPAVLRSVLVPPEGVMRTHPDVLFKYLEALVAVDPEGTTVWAAPAMFDLAQLTSLFGGRKPWVYKQERDMSTLYRMIDPDKRMAPPENEAAHDAAADAGWQMEYLFNLRRRFDYCLKAGEAAVRAELDALERAGG